MEQVVAKYLEHINGGSSGDKKANLFDEPVKIFTQISLHKIPNLINQKQVLCKLPNSLHGSDNAPEICLIVKDAVNEKKNRDFDQTIRKYQKIIEAQNLKDVIKMILPIKQIKLEFRPFEIKRKLSTSFNMFIADKGLHDILFSGSHLGREFQRRKKMPIEIDLEKCQDNLKETIDDILSSTSIRLQGKGPIIDVHAFNSTNTVDEAIANINAIKEQLEKTLPGGLANIKAIYLKATNEKLTLPIYLSNSLVGKNADEKKDAKDESAEIDQVKLTNNMTQLKKLRKKKKEIKRLKKNAEKKDKALKKKAKNAKKATERNLLKQDKEATVANGITATKPTRRETKPKEAKETKKPVPAKAKPTKAPAASTVVAAVNKKQKVTKPKTEKKNDPAKMKKKINLVK